MRALTEMFDVRYNVHMKTKTIMPISEARSKIFEIADEVQKTSNYYTLTERGKPKAVIISAEDFESWQETLEVIEDFPSLEKDIKKAEKEYKKGEFLSLNQLDVSSSSCKKSRKRSK